jgi:aminoglycoside phosphotransferase (APT) family kinase protein
MGTDKVFRLISSEHVWALVPEHFRPEERRAWDDIVATMAPLHLIDEVDRYVLECAAATLASFRSYAAHLDEVTRARHAKVLGEILEETLVPARAIPGLLSTLTAR